MTERKEGSTYPQSEAVSEGRRQNALVHGARSQVQIRAVARNRKRLILKRLGVQARDLDAISAVLVDVAARFAAKAELLDRYYEGRGIVQEDGNPQPTLAAYFAALNGLRLTIGRLAEHRARLGDHSAESLTTYLEATYTRGGNGDDPHGE